ncbi:raffinose/stachyose/melibiose transport system substrate-binding protein [Paenibacillus castaneae]|uniref:ABC transporter substrate-binding protein n=1 Tax=Paenibacillus castaneae TaxID=474957 RepID=UPI000C9A990E|nr:extracellular solute-binding protein [Paenibacillus castaneae]NIK77162.1 raffinose/stachyose/melibiose transport system substrate-binding protein [Paenibacillus castaneae]
MGKKSKMLMALSLVFVLILSACGSNNGNKGAATNAPKETNAPTTEATKEPAPEPVKLRVFSTFGGTDPAKEAFEKVLKQFTDAHPNVTIDNDVMSANDDGFRTKVNTDMNSGNEADLTFYFIGKDAEGFVNAGKVVPLNDILDSDSAWKDGINPAVLELVKQPDGKIMSIPVTGYYEGMFVNKKLFADNNIELPTDWDKLEAAVKAFAAKGIIPISAPFDQSHYLIEHSILTAAGPESQSKALTGDIDPNWELGLNGLKKLYELGAFPKDAATIDLGMAQNYYYEGLAAMLIEGSWAIGGMSPEVKDNSTVIPYPVVPGGKGSGNDIVGGFGSGFYLAQKTFDDAKKKDTAIALLKHLTSKTSIQTIAQSNGGSPAADVEITGQPQVALDGFAMVSKANSISSAVDGKMSPETFTTIRSFIKPIVTGEKTAKEALEAAKKIEDANK